MRKFYLFVFIVLLNILAISDVIAQSGRRKEATVSSPSGLKPIPDNLPPPTQIRRLPDNLTESGDVPDYVVYETVFRLAKISWSPEVERTFSPLEIMVCRRYKIKKLLNKNQEKALTQIAEETLVELDKLAQKAKPLIEEFRAKMRNGSPVQSEGRPMPPPELEEISKKRIAVIEEAYEKLKSSFGEKDFARFNDFVNENIRSKFKTATIIPTP